MRNNFGLCATLTVYAQQFEDRATMIDIDVTVNGQHSGGLHVAMFEVAGAFANLDSYDMEGPRGRHPACSMA
jgi:methenyltetrahydromethanopterin cyclohydrolase